MDVSERLLENDGSQIVEEGLHQPSENTPMESPPMKVSCALKCNDDMLYAFFRL